MHVLPDGAKIRATGEIDRRLRHGIRRIVADPSFDRDFILEDVARQPGYERQFEEWCGDISGRFVGLFASVASYTENLHPDLSECVRAIARLQKTDGRFGVDGPTDELDYAMIWGHGRLLIGLMEYWMATGDDVALQTARRLGDYYRQTLSRWTSEEAIQHERYMFYCQGLEGIVALYRATREAGYLDVANAMAMGIRPQPWWHSHGYMSALRGALDLYDVTRDPSLLNFVQARVEEIATHHLMPDGTPPELFPWSERDEGCSTADWLRLQLHLGRVTGQGRYFDAAERSLLNGLYGNQTVTGSFTHHHFAPQGYSGLGVDAWWCCAYHGPLGIYHAIRHTFGWDDDVAYVNLPINARAQMPLPSSEIDLEQSISYGSQGRYALQIHAAPSEGIRLAIRLPGWAKSHTLEHNGRPMATEAAEVLEGYVRPRNRFKAGDVVALTVPLGIRLEPWKARERTLWYGPFLLVPEVPGGHVSALALPEPGPAGFVDLPRLAAPDRPWTIPDAHFAVVGLGQEMGQSIETIGRSRPEVARLRPLSEQTAFPCPPPTALGLPVFLVPQAGRLREELDRAMRGAAMLGTVIG